MTDAALTDVLHWLWDAGLPDSVGRRARALLLDTVGCAIAGGAADEVAALFRHGAAADPGPLRLPGVQGGVSAALFAQGFGAAACWHEACEGLAVAHGRPGLHAITAVLGPAMARGATLDALLRAVVAGYEVGGRLGIACRIRPGMHVDGTWGSLGAAAAAARLFGATADQALGAVQHAACHMPFGLYWPIAAGSTARNAYVGHGAAHGAASAVAALAGLGGPAGSVAEMTRLALDSAVGGIAPPGRWLVSEGYLKPYPAVRHVHYGAAAGEAWHREVGRPDAITSVRLRVYQEALTYCGNRAPATGIAAQFSLSFGLARALAHGRLDPDAYTPRGLADPVTRRVEALMVLEADPERTEAGRRGATVTVEAGGQVWRRAVDSVPGDADAPMNDAAVRAKFMAYAGPVIGAAHAGAIAARLMDGPADAVVHLGG